MAHEPRSASAAEAPSESILPVGLLRRFLNAWRRWEDAMDYGPNDHALDRLRALEGRIERMEQRLAAVSNHSECPMATPTHLESPGRPAPAP